MVHSPTTKECSDTDELSEPGWPGSASRGDGYHPFKRNMTLKFKDYDKRIAFRVQSKFLC